MRKKISVIGGKSDTAAELAGYADLDGEPHGSDIVVVAGDADLELVRVKAPAAAVLVLDGPERCQQVYEATLFPRGRIIGVDHAELVAVAQSILFERGDEHEVIALADGAFAPRRVRIGRRGIVEVL